MQNDLWGGNCTPVSDDYLYVRSRFLQAALSKEKFEILGNKKR